jgi:hypothetical protein
MLYLFGAKTESERIGKVDISCSNCGARPCWLFFKVTKGTLYFVSVANLKRTYFVACGNCNKDWEIDTALGERLHRHLNPGDPALETKSLPETAQGALQNLRKTVELGQSAQALPTAARGLLQNLRNMVDLEGDGPSASGEEALTEAEATAQLCGAVSEGDVKQVKALLKRGANVNGVDGSGWTPLMRAADGGHLEAARLLLERGADVTCPSRNGFTPLMRAFLNGHTEMVELLRQHGAKS